MYELRLSREAEKILRRLQTDRRQQIERVFAVRRSRPLLFAEMSQNPFSGDVNYPVCECLVSTLTFCPAMNSLPVISTTCSSTGSTVLLTCCRQNWDSIYGKKCSLRSPTTSSYG